MCLGLRVLGVAGGRRARYGWKECSVWLRVLVVAGDKRAGHD